MFEQLQQVRERAKARRRQRRNRIIKVLVLLAVIVTAGTIAGVVYPNQSQAYLGEIVKWVRERTAPASFSGVPETPTDVPEYGENVPENLGERVVELSGNSGTATPSPDRVPEFPAVKTDVPEKILVHVITGVDQGFLNLRSGPGLSYPVLAVLEEGQELPFLDCTDHWVRVQYGNLTGFIYAQYTDADCGSE